MSTSITLNDLEPKKYGFNVIFGDFWLQKSELRQNGWRQTKITCEQELLQAFARFVNFAQITCYPYVQRSIKSGTEMRCGKVAIFNIDAFF